jgi:hypothetical protein
MKKVLLMIIVCGVLFAGCEQEIVVDKEGAVVSESITTISDNNQAIIFKDAKTQCRYMAIVATTDYNVAITQMFKKDGLPDCD